MKLVTHEQLVPNTVYYIQSPYQSGNGKQKGVFTTLHFVPVAGIVWARFENVEDVTGRGTSGYASGNRHFRNDLCSFYLPQRDKIIERNRVNGALKAIVGDPCFEFYVSPRLLKSKSEGLLGGV